MDLRNTLRRAINPNIIVVAILLMTSSALRAQYKKNLMFGFKTGAAYSGISNTGAMIVSETYYSGYSLTEEDRFGALAGFFVNYKFEGSSMAIQPELSYVQMGGLLNYSDVNGLDYAIDFKYNYIRLNFLAKVYIVDGFHAFAGPGLALNVTPANIFYTSNHEDLYGPDIQTQQQLRNVLKGKSDFGLCAGLGYEFKRGLTIEAAYTFGLSDVIETQVNSYKFVENDNRSHSVQLTIGYAFASDSRNFR
jgi:opacity protein-like surface antigen